MRTASISWMVRDAFILVDVFICVYVAAHMLTVFEEIVLGVKNHSRRSSVLGHHIVMAYISGC